MKKKWKQLAHTILISNVFWFFFEQLITIDYIMQNSMNTPNNLGILRDKRLFNYINNIILIENIPP